MTKEVTDTLTADEDTDDTVSNNSIDNINVWDIVEIPAFEGKKAFVLPGAFYGACVALMAKAGFERAVNVEEADVVVFIGGVDVDPKLYGEEIIAQTQTPSKERDALEQAVYDKCVEMGKVMFGICRGAQFLHVMNGGALWQDVKGHAGPSHWIYDTEDDCLVWATSLHHQMLAINNRMDVLAVCKDQISDEFRSADMVLDLKKEGANAAVEVEIEAGMYWDTKCFFVQGHPEVGDPEYQSWSLFKLQEFMEALDEIEDPLDVEIRTLREEEIAAMGGRS